MLQVSFLVLHMLTRDMEASISVDAIVAITFGLSATILSIIAIIVSMRRERSTNITSTYPANANFFQPYLSQSKIESCVHLKAILLFANDDSN
jgi:hypothetical protein